MIENDTTKRLEARARVRGLALRVRKATSSTGMTGTLKPGFYVISQAGLNLTYPMLLGESLLLAYEAIEAMEGVPCTESTS